MPPGADGRKSNLFLKKSPPATGKTGGMSYHRPIRRRTGAGYDPEKERHALLEVKGI
jgi:hypothetical protein